MNKILIEISVGELLDKISILEIKKEKIKNPEKLKFINDEYSVLKAELNQKIKPDDKMRLRFSDEDSTRIYSFCRRPYFDQRPEIVVCDWGGGDAIMFNEKTLNYSRAFFSAHALGYKEDTMMVAYGNCEKF